MRRRSWLLVVPLFVLGLLTLWHTAIFEGVILFGGFVGAEVQRLLTHRSLNLGADWAAWWHPGLDARYHLFLQDKPLQQLTRAVWLVFVVAIGLVVVQVLLNRRPQLSLGASAGSARWATRQEAQRFTRSWRMPSLSPYVLVILRWLPRTTLLMSWRVRLAMRVQHLPRPASYLSLGRSHGRPILLSETQQERHVLIVGPTGQGKSSAIIIPGLLAEQGSRSVFIIDPKGELMRLTGGALARFHQVWVFSPESPTGSQHYNPLAHIDSLDDAQDFALGWIANTGNSSEPFWDRMAETLLVAVVMHLRSAEPEAPFGRLVDLITLPLVVLQEILAESPDPVAQRTGTQFMANLLLNKRTASGLVTDLASRFARFQSPGLQRVTADDDLDFAAMTAQPTALYLSIPASAAERLRPLSACLLMQMFTCWARLADKAPGQRLPRGMVAYLDEFAHAGKVPGMAQYVAMLRSQRVALILAIQNHSQLEQIYGPHDTQTILANTTTHLLLPGGGQHEVEYYSRRIGQTTVRRASLTTGGVVPGMTSGGQYWSQSEHVRPLITPDELRTLPTGHALVLTEQLAPLLLDTCPYFRQRRLVRLTRVSVPQMVANASPTMVDDPRQSGMSPIEGETPVAAPLPQLPQ